MKKIQIQINNYIIKNKIIYDGDTYFNFFNSSFKANYGNNLNTQQVIDEIDRIFKEENFYSLVFINFKYFIKSKDPLNNLNKDILNLLNYQSHKSLTRDYLNLILKNDLCLFENDLNALCSLINKNNAQYKKDIYILKESLLDMFLDVNKRRFYELF